MAKVVLITGGSSGIGEAIAKHLSSFSDYKVYATSRNIATGSIINGIIFIQLDVSIEESVNQGINYLLAQENRIDVLINNAGIGFAGPLEETSLEEFEQVFKTNVNSILLTCKAVIGQMRKQGAGRIINISSLAGRFGLPFRGVYSATKFAVEGLSETLSQELQQFGIKVSVIAPGDFSTNISQNRKTSQSKNNSPYKGQFEESYAIVNKEVAEADHPYAIAMAVRKILENNNPKLHYIIANRFQRLTILLKIILPQRLFEKLLMNHYKIPRQ